MVLTVTVREPDGTLIATFVEPSITKAEFDAEQEQIEQKRVELRACSGAASEPDGMCTCACHFPYRRTDWIECECE